MMCVCVLRMCVCVHPHAFQPRLHKCPDSRSHEDLEFFIVLILLVWWTVFLVCALSSSRVHAGIPTKASYVHGVKFPLTEEARAAMASLKDCPPLSFVQVCMYVYTRSHTQTHMHTHTTSLSLSLSSSPFSGSVCMCTHTHTRTLGPQWLAQAQSSSLLR